MTPWPSITSRCGIYIDRKQTETFESVRHAFSPLSLCRLSLHSDSQAKPAAQPVSAQAVMPASLAGLAAHAGRVRAAEKRARDPPFYQDLDDDEPPDPCIDMSEDELEEADYDDEEEVVGGQDDTETSTMRTKTRMTKMRRSLPKRTRAAKSRGRRRRRKMKRFCG